MLPVRDNHVFHNHHIALCILRDRLCSLLYTTIIEIMKPFQRGAIKTYVIDRIKNEE